MHAPMVTISPTNSCYLAISGPNSFVFKGSKSGNTFFSCGLNSWRKGLRYKEGKARPRVAPLIQIKASSASSSSDGNGTVRDETEALNVQYPGCQISEISRLKPYDYGFNANFIATSPSVPSSAISLAFKNFAREYKALRRNYLFVELSDIQTDNIKRGPLGLVAAYTGRALLSAVRFLDRFLTLYDGLPEIKPKVEEADELQLKEILSKLTLDNDAVWAREHAREKVVAPWIILVPYYVLCYMLDFIFYNRPIQRFWFLETVARMPYFSYISMLHLYETLGWWRIGAEVRKVHFAEEWNEMQHLKIMESLGGDRWWIDRFFGQHAAFFYYWILNFLFLVSPKIAYNFSELIEMHAVDTYGTFVDENEALLKSLPPPITAMQYYNGDDLYMFDEFQTSRPPASRRPLICNLYDVFSAIRDDEGEHVKTMVACQRLDTVVISPNRQKHMQEEELGSNGSLAEKEAERQGDLVP